MKKYLVFLASLFMASNAFADLSGTWSGPVELTSQGMSQHCPIFSYTIWQTPAVITIRTVAANCFWPGDDVQQNPETTFPASSTLYLLEGQNVLLNNQVVGTITDNTLVLHNSLTTPDGVNETTDVNYTRSGDTLTMTSTTVMYGRVGLLLQGQLLKKQ